MEKELLLAIGDDRAASYNLRFLKKTFTAFCDLKLTLFYVTPLKPSWEVDESKIVPRGSGFDEFVKHSKHKGEKALTDAKQWIQDVAGCSGENVRTKVVHSQKGTVRELIDEAHKGMYDALLLGRKGFSWFEDLFTNSVCHKMLWSDIDFPIWICKRPPDTPLQDVLLAMDGSKASLRMVDHAAHMLAEEEHTLTLFHVAQQGFESARSARIFDEGLAILDEHGIAEDRIELKMVTARNVVKAITKEVKEGHHTAVGVGKHGAHAQSSVQGIFPSSVTVNLMRQLEHTALWVSK
ncbi:universal stress protein [Pseudodesulfovibrio piezophilus]|uniref:Putative UspA domain protein n=1 Tax=Pseudodesulfovibrio piezophilus (strain DSM 21447 / JCM 15486 / C1TLV30) TaxID=1322246 RepID=M1WMA5_PSEP2|nr:universal stress protein [Pseudodesulfovibrio piezophilus]CCH49265.1 putative UspA domain protein [Pseudodesulfovibrio piezophilus C1TLV30]